MYRTTSISTTLLSIFAATALLAGCGQPADEPPPPPAATPEQQPPPAAEPAPAPAPEPAPAAEPADEAPAADAVSVDADGVAQVRIGSTDQMQYTVSEFAVDAGQEVELTLIHEGRLQVEVMGHNVVILQQGEEALAFGGEVMVQGGAMDNDYLPESMRDRTIAFTSMIGGGETTSVSFTAPDEPGEYVFVCTFPGHFGAMNGKMIVR